MQVLASEQTYREDLRQLSETRFLLHVTRKLLCYINSAKSFSGGLNDVQECNCSIEERLITLWRKWHSGLFTAFRCR